MSFHKVLFLIAIFCVSISVRSNDEFKKTEQYESVNNLLEEIAVSEFKLKKLDINSQQFKILNKKVKLPFELSSKVEVISSDCHSDRKKCTAEEEELLGEEWY